MNYPGNPSLAQDVQERISNTFQQTLDLVADQRDQEALVGCEFILRMDPEFQPAKILVARLRSVQRPVSVDDLRTPPAGGAPAIAAPASVAASAAPTMDAELGDLADLDDLDSLDDLGDLDSLEDLDLDDDLPVTGAPAAPKPAAPALVAAAAPIAMGSGLATVLADLLAKRNFERILQIAQTQRQAVESDPAVGALVEKAQGLLESETYVQAFIQSARQAQAEGRPEEMENHLRKARALDPEHPDLQALVSGGAPQPSVGAGAPDDDLMALQQQSLSLESGKMAKPTTGELAENLARDPRQTKPMAAVAFTESDDIAAPAADDLISADALADDGAAHEAPLPPLEDDFDAELFDNEATDAAVGNLDAELFDLDGEAGEASGGESLEDLGTEFLDDHQAAISDEAPLPSLEDDLGAELTLDDQGAPAVSESADGSDRVGELIAEGQEAFDRGEYQTAIDVWSRIFLIDIDNPEASQRIEEARSKKAELERQAEELFHEAVTHLESESLDEAKSTLTKVLELAPSHALAREYLEQLASGKVPVISGGDLDVSLAEDGAAGFGGDEGTEAGSPTLEAAVARDRVVVVKKTDTKIIALGAAVLLAILGTGAFLMLKWDDWFPNQEAPPKMTQQARKVDPIERATNMHEGGNTENAILLLERIQPQDQIYEDAQALIAQWKALVEAPPEDETGPSEEQTERHGLFVRAARDAHNQGRHIRARKYFERASKILPLSTEDQALKSDGDLRLESLEAQIKLFDGGQYAAVIPALWRKREGEPNNLDIQRLLVDSYYNLALTDLQRGNTKAAAKKLREAQEVQPDNEELQRLQLFAKTYSKRQQDLLYRIFVKYLPSR